MKLVWTDEAVNDLENIVEYIREDNPEAAHRVALHIFKTVTSLPRMPFRGRPRTEDEAREIVFAPWPYVAVYEITDQVLYVKAIRHTSRAV